MVSKSGKNKSGKIRKKSDIHKTHQKFTGANPATWKNNQDNIKLLISYPEFQKDIKEIRAKLNMPETGFSYENNRADLKKWYDEEIDKKSDKIISSESFQKQVKLLRKKFLKKEIGWLEHEKLLHLLHLKLPRNFIFPETILKPCVNIFLQTPLLSPQSILLLRIYIQIVIRRN